MLKKNLTEKVNDTAGRQFRVSVVKPTRSQNKMVASATLSAMISPDRREAALKALLL